MWTYRLHNGLGFTINVDLYKDGRFAHMSARVGSREEAEVLGIGACFWLNLARTINGSNAGVVIH